MRQTERDQRRMMTDLLVGIDLTELQLAILDVLDQFHCGPEFRKAMGTGAQLGAMLDAAGGPREVLLQAIERIRARHGLAGPG